MAFWLCLHDLFQLFHPFLSLTSTFSRGYQVLLVFFASFGVSFVGRSNIIFAKSLKYRKSYEPLFAFFFFYFIPLYIF
ncbi:hypothetical protein BJ508DRAFT_156478 [Ascobolus immersus RN42]|uniref:Uncharacterized protein n=1 Tax=Ascobolus immersus RN42 TaxID=1160509 RepID=A0A3N4I2E8_ASCIM|nr:hypothetical protein BJ508DRAFT_156478 [Ascobolus immersus RN42]